MTAFIPFADIKAQVRIEQVVDMLELKVKREGGSIRARCPVCQTKDPRALWIVPKTQSFKCWAAKGRQVGSDLIALVMHVRGIDNQAAAREIAAHFSLTIPDSSPRPPAAEDKSPQTARSPTLPEDLDEKLRKVLAELQYEHPMVQALGLSPALAKALKIGFQRGGTKGNRVLFPVYYLGRHVDFYGYNPEKDPVFLFSPNLAQRFGFESA